MDGIPPRVASGFSSARGALRGGLVEGLGAPAFVLGASYVGIGALARDADISLPFIAISTLAIYALPAQVVLVELWQVGTAFPALVLAVMMTSARFLPMTATLMPLLRHERWSAPHYALAAHCVAMTGWAITMRRAPDLPAVQRLPYFFGYTVVLLSGSVLGTSAGYILSAYLTDFVTLGLVFLNPILFTLIRIRETRARLGILALICGMIVGPLVHLAIPEWSLLVGGILAGSLAFALDEALKARR